LITTKVHTVESIIPLVSVVGCSKCTPRSLHAAE
jgi:hypothetical protein